MGGNPLNRSTSLFCFILLLGLVSERPAPAEERRRDWREFPALTALHLDAQGGAVRAATDPDSVGNVLWVTFDAKRGRWSRPAPGSPLPGSDSLASVRVFDGSLFDKYSGTDRIVLGDGFTLARRDTGLTLIRDADGVDLGWPRVSEEEIDKWAKEVRLGLPRDYPAERMRQLLKEGRLRNEPGPTVHTNGGRWFAVAGGFTGGEGQFGGLVRFDSTSGAFTVIRHTTLVDAAVTRLFAHQDALWIGTARYGPTSIEGLSGLILYRPEKREWRQFSMRNSRIAGDLVWDLAADDNFLWATTNEGVCRYDLKRKLWSSWFWHRAKDGSGFELTTELPGTLAEELVR